MRTKPVLIYDGRCGFCRIWLNYWRALLGDSIGYLASQDLAAEDFPQLDRDALKSAVYLVLPDGTTFRGAHAVFRSLAPVALRYNFCCGCTRVLGYSARPPTRSMRGLPATATSAIT